MLNRTVFCTLNACQKVLLMFLLTNSIYSGRCAYFFLTINTKIWQIMFYFVKFSHPFLDRKLISRNQALNQIPTTRSQLLLVFNSSDFGCLTNWNKGPVKMSDLVPAQEICQTEKCLGKLGCSHYDCKICTQCVSKTDLANFALALEEQKHRDMFRRIFPKSERWAIAIHHILSMQDLRNSSECYYLFYISGKYSEQHFFLFCSIQLNEDKTLNEGEIKLKLWYKTKCQQDSNWCHYE